MKIRDEAIVAADAAYAAMKAEIAGRQEVLREKQIFLDEQKANNAQVEARISYADRQLAKARAQYSLVQSSIVEYPIIKLIVEETNWTIQGIKTRSRRFEILLGKQRLLLKLKKQKFFF